jgi:zinc transport system permease protein
MIELVQAVFAGAVSFFQALADPDLAFLRYAFLAGMLSSIAFGITGTYVVTRRIAAIAGAISHCVLGGIGAALYLGVVHGWTWLLPIYGAIAAALVAAVLIGLVSLYARQREDTVIGAMWAIGMAVGVIFIKITPGYSPDIMSYLFGDILLITRSDLVLVLLLDAVVVGLCVLFYPKLLAVCFDEEFTKLRGVRTEVYYLLLLCLTALTVVLLMRVVGLIMVIALLTLPAAVAGHFTRRMGAMMGLAVVFCMGFTGIGLGYSYVRNLPSGAVIIVFAGLVYLAVVGGSRLRKMIEARTYKKV